MIRQLSRAVLRDMLSAGDVSYGVARQLKILFPYYMILAQMEDQVLIYGLIDLKTTSSLS